MKKLLLTGIVLGCMLSGNIVLADNDIKEFSDVAKSHWAYEVISTMAQKNVILGFSDGSFRPNESVTREQFAKIMVLSLELPMTEPENPTFSDVNKDYWAYKYIESAKDYLNGYKDENGSMKFKGSNNAIREEIAYALVKAKGYENESIDVNKLKNIFKDANQISSELQKNVLIAYEKGLISGNADNTFNPKGTLTRAEAAKILNNALKSVVDQERGNSIGNYGFAARKGEWIYYSDKNNQNILRKIKTDGSERAMLDDAQVWDINVVGEWIYYVGCPFNTDGEERIYKIKNDGTEKSVICDDRPQHISVVDDWIYYTSFDYKYMYKIKTDGTDKTKLLSEEGIVDFNVVDGWIYYPLGDGLYKIRTDGTDRKKLCNDMAGYMNVVGNKIYYLDNIDGPYRIDTDGRNRVRIINDKYDNCLNVHNDWIYFSNSNDDSKLYKMRTNGTEKTKISDDKEILSIDITDVWIYYEINNSDNCSEFYRIRLDGTGRELVE